MIIGATLGGRYAILRQIGKGGMGAVYEARHTGTNRRVAVKVITDDVRKNPVLVARFEIEAKAAGTIESQHVAQVLDVGYDEAMNLPFLVMEYLSGEDVLQLIKRLGPLPVKLAVHIAAQASLGLTRAHRLNIIHRDIKSANLFLSEQDASEHVVKILDFGIAKIKPPEDDPSDTGGITSTGSLVGSPLYMSPEQARGSQQIDHRSDIWSLGIVLYQMLTGRTPFHGVEGLGELILRICSEPIASVQIAAPWVTPDVAQIVGKALVVDVNRRYQSAEEMFMALRKLLPSAPSIDTSMLVPLEASERAVVAPLLTPSGAATARASVPSAPELTVAEPAAAVPTLESGAVRGSSDRFSASSSSRLVPVMMSTNAGVTLAPRRRGRVALAATVGLVGLGVLGAGAFMARRAEREAPALAATEPAPRAGQASARGDASAAPPLTTENAEAGAPARSPAPAVAAPSASASAKVPEGKKPAERVSPTPQGKKEGAPNNVDKLLGQD